MKKKGIIISVISSALMFLFAAGMIIGIAVESKRNTRFIHINFKLEESVSDEQTKYTFIDQKYANYICQLAPELGIDPDLVVAHLMVENPEFNTQAIHKNENGTVDIGLGQLNSAYIWSTFKKSYWNFDTELDPFNWKHNLYIMMRHIEYLSRSLKVTDDVIMAYNCGVGNVINHTIPESTKAYLSRVKNNLILLKSL